MTSDAVAVLSTAEKRALLQRLVEQKRIFPASAGQRRLWFLQQLAPESAAYHFPVALRITGPYNSAVLSASVQALVDRHAVFRTVFAEQDGEIVQRVQPGLSVPFDVVDARALSSEAFRTLVTERAIRPINLATGPVFHGALFERSPADAVLLLVWHHIVLDGWSLALVLEEFDVIHKALAFGEEPGLPAAPPYSEFVEWQRTIVAGERGEQHAAFWQQTLQQAQRLELPTDKPRPVTRGYQGDSVRFTLGESLTARVQQLAAQLDTTTFVVLLAAFQALLHRVSGNNSVPVTFPVNGRTNARFNKTAGYFVNQVAVDGHIDAATTFNALVAATKAKVVAALHHQDYHLSLLPPLLEGGDDVQQRVADVMFVLQKSQGYQLEMPRGMLRESAMLANDAVARHGALGGLAVEAYPVENNTSRFDFELHMTEAGGALVGWLQFDVELFRPSTARTFTECFQQLLASVTTDARQRIATLNLLDVGQQRLLAACNRTERQWPAADGIAGVFRSIVQRLPNATAVRCNGRALTFQELDRESNRVANWLQQAGAQPQQLVGLCVPRSLNMLVALLGIIKAGCVYLPLDPANPSDRLSFMLEDSRAALVVTSHETHQRIESTAATRLCLDGPDSRLQASPDTPLTGVDGPLLYAIYTSGSSGQPKAVLGTTAGALNRMYWQWEHYPFVEGEVCAQLTTLSFVDAVAEIFAALLAGVSIAIVPDDSVRDIERLVQALEMERVTRVTLVPSLLRVLLEVNEPCRRLASVRSWSCSGEAMDAALAQRFHATLPAATLLNLYGCSEASADSTCFEVPSDWNGAGVPIGHPIANTQVYILDRYDNPVPRGSTGQIHIGGAGVAAGYLHRAALSAERFVADPFVPGFGMYRTGDLGRQGDDGTFEYLGRADQQLKIRGNRVEAGEVQAVLRKYPGVESAAVMGVPEPSGDRVLVAYVVARDAGAHAHSTTLASRLRAHVADRLPGYMVPSHVVLLDAMPLTASGKINWSLLPAPNAGESGPAYSAPRSRTERQVADIWQRVLGVARLSVDADFFEAGGHSILALQAAAQVATLRGLPMPVAVLFQYPTVRQLAAHLDGAPAELSRHRLVTIESRGDRPPLFWIPGGVGALGFVKLKLLSATLGTDQPFYGFATQWASSLTEVESVPARAAQYLKLIREAQPTGPYHLVGFCLGGVIAFEMAQRLEAEGERVAYLALVNTWMPASAIERSRWLLFFAQRAAYYLKVAAQQRTMPLHRFLLHRAQNLRRIVRRERFAEVEQLLMRTAAGSAARDELLPEETTFLATVHLASQYRPRRFDGRVHVFVSAETEVRGVSPRLDPRRAWRRVAARCDIVEVGGGHMPSLDELGRALHRSLRAAESAVRAAVQGR